MQARLERKQKINHFLINTRWFYVGIIIFAGIYQQTAANQSLTGRFFYFVGLMLLSLIANGGLFYFQKAANRHFSAKKIDIVSFCQILADILLFALLLFGLSGPAKSAVMVIFLLPIVSGALLFDIGGAVISAFVSGIIAIAAVGAEGHFLSSPAADSSRFLGGDLLSALFAAAVYLVIGIFAGYASALLAKHEASLEADLNKLREENGVKNKELNQLNNVATLLVKRDSELTATNKELDQKVAEVEKSRETLLKAYKDVQEVRAEIEEEKNKTQAVIANFISPIIVLDKNNKIIIFNPPAQKYLGMKYLDYGRKIEGKHYYSLEDFKEVIRAEHDFSEISEDKKEEGVLLQEQITVKIDKQEYFFKVITVEIIGRNGDRFGVMKIFNDLTREKVLDKLKSEFISVAAHQLRTPLAAIKWVFEMVLSGDTGEINDEQRNFLAKGHESNERIIDLVNDLLNVSRIEEGRFGYSFGQFDFEEIITKNIDFLETAMRKNNINLIVNKPKRLKSVYMDKDRIYMVFQNILENAIKYTPEHGKIEINISDTEDKQFLQVAIKDNGVGIPEKDKAKLFSKFFRASNVVRMETKGSGLGLFMCKNIIDSHDGQIWVESEEGKGTSVIFTIPHKKVINK